LIAFVLVAGCGSSGAPAGATKITLSDYKYDPNHLSVKAGKVTFYLTNIGTQSHDMLIADPSGNIVAKSDLVQANNDSTFSVSQLPAGSYQIYCDVPGHRALGMEGTLTAT
jgi:plastocyanin